MRACSGLGFFAPPVPFCGKPRLDGLPRCLWLGGEMDGWFALSSALPASPRAIMIGCLMCILWPSRLGIPEARIPEFRKPDSRTPANAALPLRRSDPPIRRQSSVPHAEIAETTNPCRSAQHSISDLVPPSALRRLTLTSVLRPPASGSPRRPSAPPTLRPSSHAEARGPRSPSLPATIRAHEGCQKRSRLKKAALVRALRQARTASSRLPGAAPGFRAEKIPSREGCPQGRGVFRAGPKTRVHFTTGSPGPRGQSSNLRV
jgi:hypothetical protein